MDEITRNKIREALEREFKSHDVKEEVTDSFIDGLVAEVKTDMDSEFTPGAVVTTYNDSIDLLSTEIFDQIKNGGNFKKVDELQQEQNRIRYKLMVYKCMYGENTESLPDSLSDLPYEDELDDVLDSVFNTEKKEDTNLDSDIGFDVLKDDEEPEDQEEDQSDFEGFDFDDKDTDENDDGFSFDEFDSDDEDSDSLKDCGLDNSFDCCFGDSRIEFGAHVDEEDKLCVSRGYRGQDFADLTIFDLTDLGGYGNDEALVELIEEHISDEDLDLEKCLGILISMRLASRDVSYMSTEALEKLKIIEKNTKILKKAFDFVNELYK